MIRDITGHIAEVFEKILESLARLFFPVWIIYHGIREIIKKYVKKTKF